MNISLCCKYISAICCRLMKHKLPCTGCHSFRVLIQEPSDVPLDSSSEDDEEFPPSKKTALYPRKKQGAVEKVWDSHLQGFRYIPYLKRRKNGILHEFYVTSAECNCGQCKVMPYWISTKCYLKVTDIEDPNGDIYPEYTIECVDLMENVENGTVVLRNSKNYTSARSPLRDIRVKEGAKKGILFGELHIDKSGPSSRAPRCVYLYFKLVYEDKLYEHILQIQSSPDDYSWPGLVCWVKNQKDISKPYLALIMDIDIHNYTMNIAWCVNSPSDCDLEDISKICRSKIVDDPLSIELKNAKLHSMKLLYRIRHDNQVITAEITKVDTWYWKVSVVISKDGVRSDMTIDRDQLIAKVCD